MKKDYRCLVVPTLCVLALLTLLTQGGYAQTVDKAAQALDLARGSYEKTMQSVRENVRTAIKAKIDAASKSDSDSVKAAVGEQDAFNATGEWPNILRVQQLRERAARAAEGMRGAYRQAVAEYAKADNIVLRDAVTAEADQFEHQCDVAPWTENLIKNLAEADRTLRAGAKPLSVAMPIEGSYRIEVIAKRGGETGYAILECPVAKGKRLAIPMTSGADGSIRVLLSIDDETICADLGVKRPVDLSKAIAKDGRDILVVPDNATIVVESIRIKPLVDGEPEQLAERPNKDAKNKPKVVQQAPPLHSRWSGTFRNTKGAHDATAELRSLDGNQIVFRLTVGNYGTRDWVFAINGNSLVVNELIFVSGHQTAIKNIRISGKMSDTRLQVSGSWIWQADRGAGEDVRLELTRD